MSLADAYRFAAEVMTENMMARDAEEGIGAFIEKREPKWQDRMTFRLFRVKRSIPGLAKRRTRNDSRFRVRSLRIAPERQPDGNRT